MAWGRFQGGCLSCPLPVAGRSPEVLPSRSLSAVPGLAPVGPVSSQSFPSYCFLGSLRLQQLFPSLGLPLFFGGERFVLLSSCPLPAPSDSNPSPPPLFIPPATTYQALLPSLHTQLGGCWLCSSLTALWTPPSPFMGREGAQSQHDAVLSNLTHLSTAFCFNEKTNWEKGQLCKTCWKMISLVCT